MEHDEQSSTHIPLDFDSVWIEIPEDQKISTGDGTAFVRADSTFGKSSVKAEPGNGEFDQRFSTLLCNDDRTEMIQILQKIVATDTTENKFAEANLEALNCLTSLLDLFLMRLCSSIALLYDRNLLQNNSFDTIDHILFDVVERAFKIVGVGDLQTLKREFDRRKFESYCESVEQGNYSKTKQELLDQDADQSMTDFGVV